MRLDRAVVAAGLADSRSRAQDLIAQGRVLVDGTVVTRAAFKVQDQSLALDGAAETWVSRAAQKLRHALEHFDLSPEGAIAADIGASTGGFTQVLLSAGAAHVHAVDVGHGQMHALIAEDPRVSLHEGVNARDLPEGLLPRLDWVVSDVSFISATKALPRTLARARPQAVLVCLVKPQFEVGPARVGKGGIVRDPADHALACDIVADFVRGAGWAPIGLTQSPMTGSDGNVEFLLAARKN